MAKGGFWTVFGTATLPTGAPEPTRRGKEFFRPDFGTATMPISTPEPSLRGEGSLLDGLRHGDPFHRTSEPTPRGHCELVYRIVALLDFVKFTWNEPLLIIK